jgi:hypothetical protein
MPHATCREFANHSGVWCLLVSVPWRGDVQDSVRAKRGGADSDGIDLYQ